MQLKTIDLFVGAGGLTEGFRQAGHRALFANDFDKYAAQTCSINHTATKVSDESIEELDAKTILADLNLKKGELDAVIGGPPCQGFSTYGQRDKNDPRNQLYLHFIRFLDEFRPKTFLIENVAGLISMSGGAVLADICEKIRALGYSVEHQLLDAADYGVPQFRKRVFIVGSSSGLEVGFPEPTHKPQATNDSDQLDAFSDLNLSTHTTVWDAISDLKPADALPPRMTATEIPYPENGELTQYQNWARGDCPQLSNHSAKQMLGIRRLRLALLRPGDYGRKIAERVKAEGLPYDVIDEILSGGSLMRDISKCRTEDREKEAQLRELLHSGHNDIGEILRSLEPKGFANKYRRLHWDQPAHTLVAHMARDCSDFVHPDLDRFITVREAARLQSFRDSYTFFGSQFQQFKQIGNAVPPLLGKALAEHIRSFLQESEQAAA